MKPLIDALSQETKHRAIVKLRTKNLTTLNLGGGNEMNTCYLYAPCDFDEEDIDEYS